MDSNTPLFSIVVPAYNAETMIGYTLQSIECQDYTDFELVLVDDGSSDKTKSIMDSYALRHRNTIVISGHNQGPLIARRLGLNASHGEYIIFIDSDDCFRCDALSYIAKAVHESQADIVIFGYSRSKDYKKYSESDVVEEGVYCGESLLTMRKAICQGKSNALWGKTIKRSCLDMNDSYAKYAGMIYAEDLFQLLPIINNANKIAVMSEALYYYRPSIGSLTSTYNSRKLHDIGTVCKRLNDYANEWGDECVQASIEEESKLYITMIYLAAKSMSEKSQLNESMEEIRTQMISSGSYERLKTSNSRIDRRVVITLLRFRQYRLLKHTVLLRANLARLSGKVR